MQLSVVALATHQVNLIDETNSESTESGYSTKTERFELLAYDMRCLRLLIGRRC